MDLGLHDKVALVAASSKGHGYAVAAELAAEGAKLIAKLILCSRGERDLHEAADSLAANSNVELIAVAGVSALGLGWQILVSRLFTTFNFLKVKVFRQTGQKSTK